MIQPTCQAKKDNIFDFKAYIFVALLSFIEKFKVSE